MAIKIDFLSNTKSVTRDVEQIGDAFEKVSDSLDDVARDAKRSGDAMSDATRDAARDADKAGDKIGDAYKDAARDGERSAERLERAFQDASDATARASKAGGDSLGKNVKRGTEDAGDGLREFRDEANSTAKESAASFDGSAESIGDSFQEIAANAFAGFGPAGAAAGLAAAAGLGIIFSQLEKNDERTQELREQVAALAEEYINTGRVGSSSMSAIAENIKAMALATEDGETSLADLRKMADDTGVPFERLARAMAGDADALKELLDATEEQIDALDRQNISQDAVAGSGLRARSAADDQRTGLIALREQLEEQSKTQDQAAESAQNYADTGAAAIQRAAEASEEYSDQIQDAYQEAGAGVDDYAEGGKDALRKYTEEAKKQADAVTAYQKNMVQLAGMLSGEALAYVQSLGPEAAPIIADFIKAPLGQQKETAAVWSQLGSTSSNAFASQVRGDLNRASFTAPVRLNADFSNVNAELARVRTLNVIARVQNNIASQLPARQGMGVP